MCRPRNLKSVAFLLCCIALCAAGGRTRANVPSGTPQAASASPPKYFYHCWYTIPDAQANPGGTIYASGVVTVGSAADDISSDWRIYMLTKYRAASNTGASGACERLSASATEQQLSMSAEEKQWTARKLTIVHADYAFGQGATAAGPPPAQAASATGTYMYCASDIGTSPVYFSDFFAVQLPAAPQHRIAPNDPVQQLFQKVDADFLAFIRKKYNYKTNSNYPTGCPNFGSGSGALVQAQESRQKLEDQAKASKEQVIETGWTYKP